MEAGKVTKLIVDRETDIGYILTDKYQEEEVFLHYNDSLDKKLSIGEKVDVFIYIDHKKRLAATLQIPKISVFDCDWVKVVDVEDFGVFVDIGIRKDILLSKDELPFDKKLWPQVDDLLYGYLENNNNKALLFTLATYEDFFDFKKTAPSDIYGEKITVYVYRVGKEGVNVISEDYYLGFIHHNEYKETPRLGAKLLARVINVKDNGEINLSLIPQKEIALKDDKSLILEYMSNHYGKIPLGDNSTPEEIKTLLGISKAAFKRAVGALMKEQKVKQNKEKTITSLKKRLH